MLKRTKLLANARRRLTADQKAKGAGLGLHNVRSTKAQLLEVIGDDGREPVKPEFIKAPATIALIGAGQELGQPLAGTGRGPDLLRSAGLRNMLAALHWRVEDLGNLELNASATGNDKMRHGEAICLGSRLLYEQALNAHKEGKCVVTLGGDHSVALGSLSASLAARPETRVLWCDAHADINTPESSPSGNAHGMPLSFFLGLASDSRLDFIPRLQPKRLAYVGLRDLDPAERRILRALKAQGTYVATMREVDEFGIGIVMRQALTSLGYYSSTADADKISSQSLSLPPLHLSYDIDAVDPQHAPATGTVVRGGLTFREAHFVAEACAETGAMSAMDIVEVNSDLTSPEAAQETVELAVSLVASALGDSIL
mmetsp:Transcript_13969/g.21007  ORF Transcript_13969/g.21007 Transcript_13969/m.21007 type:complete len:371 (+) Transcript_13969:41-1153(+)